MSVDRESLLLFCSGVIVDKNEQRLIVESIERDPELMNQFYDILDLIDEVPAIVDEAFCEFSSLATVDVASLSGTELEAVQLALDGGTKNENETDFRLSGSGLMTRVTKQSAEDSMELIDQVVRHLWKKQLDDITKKAVRSELNAASIIEHLKANQDLLKNSKKGTRVTIAQQVLSLFKSKGFGHLLDQVSSAFSFSAISEALDRLGFNASHFDRHRGLSTLH